MNELMEECQEDHIDSEKIKKLIEKGANINLQNNWRNTALMRACFRNKINYEFIKLLIENGADMNLQNINGRTNLMLAEEGGHKSLLESIIKIIYLEKKIKLLEEKNYPLRKKIE